jgi:hypothetical protein
MMDASGAFIGEVCHIEAALTEGERFNPQMTNEERRHVSNLMLMCHEHHVITNDENAFPVARLRQIKAEHEARFANPGRAILAELRDWTQASEPTLPSSLDRLNYVLKQEVNAEDIKYQLNLIERLVGSFCNVPEEVRKFLGAVAERMLAMRGTRVVGTGMWDGGPKILVSDLAGAFRISIEDVMEMGTKLEHYGLGAVVSSWDGEPAIVLKEVDGWSFWVDLARFCAEVSEPMDAFTLDLDFARLD